MRLWLNIVCKLLFKVQKIQVMQDILKMGERQGRAGEGGGWVDPVPKHLWLLPTSYFDYVHHNFEMVYYICFFA